MKSSIILLVAGLGSAFTANLIFTPLLIRISHKKQWYDKIDHRKIHEGDIPRIGGLGIFVSFAVGAVVFFVLKSFRFAQDAAIGPFYAYWPLFTGMVLIHLVGLIDDFRNVKPWFKVAVQLTAAAVVVIFGYPLTRIVITDWGLSLPLGPATYFLSLLWIIGMTNAMNLVDGLDGLAGGISAIAAFFIGIAALFLGNFVTAAVGLILFGSLIGFLVFNFPPAKLFMGDGGSLFLGFTIATLPLFGSKSGVRATTLVIMTIAVSLIPILDTLSSMLRRTLSRKPFYHPDRAHLHHKLLDLGLSNGKILAIIYALCAFLGGAVLVAVIFDHPVFPYLVPFSWAVCILFFVLLDRVYKKRNRD